MSFYDHDRALAALEVKVSELLMATPDMSDHLIDPAIRRVLKLLREQHGMEAAFACELIGGQRVSQRCTPSDRAQFIDEEAEPLELAFCRQVLGEHQVPAGCYLSAPVILGNGGGYYGTFYSFCFNPDPAIEARDVKKLDQAAVLAARLIGERIAKGALPTAKERPQEMQAS